MTKLKAEESPGVESQIDLPTPAALMHRALASGAGVEVLERLMALQERWERNQAKKSYDAAMAELRNDLPPIIKSRKVDYTSAKGHTHYRYEDLHAVTDSLSPIMARHGLSFRWRTGAEAPDRVTVTCIVSHREGHVEETTLTASHDHSGTKNDIQALGSAVTYLQRYTLKAALGVAAADDDDGDRAGEKKAVPQSQQEPLKPQKPNGKYSLTPKHEELKGLIDGYISEYGKKHTLTENDKQTMAGEILTRITAWTDSDGREHEGKASYSDISEKQATIAIRRYHEKIERAKQAP